MTFPNPLISPAGDLTKAEIVNDANLNVVNRNRSLHNQSKKAIKTAESYLAGSAANWGGNPPNTQDLALDALAANAAGIVKKSMLVNWSKNLGIDVASLPASSVVTKVISDVQTTITTATDYTVNAGATAISATSTALTASTSIANDISPTNPTKASGLLSVVFTGVPGAGKVQFMIEYYVATAVP